MWSFVYKDSFWAVLKSICTEKDRLFRAETEIFLLNVEEFCFRKSGSQEQGILITKKVVSEYSSVVETAQYIMCQRGKFHK